MSVNEKHKEICFNHPITGITHTLYFKSPELVEFPAGEGEKHSFYIMQSMYEIEPALPQGDTLEVGSSIQYTEIPEEEFSPTATSSFGIMGGTDGHTTIFVSKNGEEKTILCGLHKLPLHSCFSVPSFQKENTSHFVIEGVNIEKHIILPPAFTTGWQILCIL